MSSQPNSGVINEQFGHAPGHLASLRFFLSDSSALPDWKGKALLCVHDTQLRIVSSLRAPCSEYVLRPERMVQRWHDASARENGATLA